LPPGGYQVVLPRYIFVIINLMGAADIINPNAGISAVTGESAYVGPNPEFVTHFYGLVSII
jgi:F0F1-type ATP synthase assembly protein I